MPRQKSTHVDNPDAVGLRLKASREAAGLSQRALAFPGCSPAYISRVEAGERIPSLQVIRELGRRLGVTEDYLARGAPNQAAPDDPRLLEADLALRMDDLDSAQQLYDELLTEAGSAGARAAALSGLGQLAFRMGNPPLSRDRFEEVVELLGDAERLPSGVAETLGRSYAALGEYEAAIGVFERSLAGAESDDDRPETIRFAVLLANALMDSGRLGRAEELLGRTLARASDLADPAARARIYWTQSRLHAQKGNPETAARYARRAVGLIELTEDTHYLARAQQLLAHIELDRGNLDAALPLIQRGVELLQGSGNPLEFHKFRLEEARAVAQQGDLEEAAAIGMEAAGALREIHPLEAGRGYGYVADAFKSLGELDRAAELYELAVETLEPGHNRYLTSVYTSLSEVLEEQGKAQEAFEALKKAMGIQARIGHEAP